MDYDFDYINQLFRADKWLEENYGCEFYRSSNGTLNCCCPFEDHNDSNPSFGISMDKMFFNCFGCGRSGSFIKLVSSLLGVSFIHATNIICAYESIDLDKVDIFEIKNEKFKQAIIEEDTQESKRQRAIMKATNKIRKILKTDFDQGEAMYKKLDQYIENSDFQSIKELINGTA
jgi:DNA primase